MAIQLGGNAKKIADAKAAADKKKHEEEEKKSASSNTWDGMKAAAQEKAASNDFKRWVISSNARTSSTDTANRALGAEQSTKPKVTYTGQKKNDERMDVGVAKQGNQSWNLSIEKKKANPWDEYMEKNYGAKKKIDQAITSRSTLKEQADQTAKANELRNLYRNGADMPETAGPVAKRHLSGDDLKDMALKNGASLQPGRQTSKVTYRGMTEEEAEKRRAATEQHNRDVQDGLAGQNAVRGGGTDNYLERASHNTQDGREAAIAIYDMLNGEMVTGVSDDEKERIGRKLANSARSDDRLRGQLDDAIWNQAQARERIYQENYGDPTARQKQMQEQMQAWQHGNIERVKQDERQIYQTNPLFAVQTHNEMLRSLDDEERYYQAMQEDMERYPDAWDQWEKDMVHDRLLVIRQDKASLGDVAREWDPDYERKSVPMEGVHDTTYAIINGADPEQAYKEYEEQRKSPEQEAIWQRADALQERLNEQRPEDEENRAAMEAELEELKKQIYPPYNDSPTAMLDEVIFSSQMSEQDRKTYNVIYREEGRDAANEFLQRTKNKWYEGWTQEELKELDGYLRKSGWNVVAENLKNVFRGMDDPLTLLRMTMKSMDGELISAYDPAFMNTRKKGYTQSTTIEQIQNSNFKVDVFDENTPEGKQLNEQYSNGLKNAAVFMYQAASSGADQYGTFWTDILLGPGNLLGLAIMGGHSGMNALMESLEKGGASRAAAARGVVNCVCEMAMERLGMERVVDMFTAGTLSREGAFRQLAKGILSEAGEEVPGDIIDREMDAWYNKDNSDRSNQTRATVEQMRAQAAMTRQPFDEAAAIREAENRVDYAFAQQVATGALMAGVSAGVAMGGSYIVGRVTGNYQQNKYEKNIINRAAEIEREYQQKYGAETAEAVRTLAQEETTEEGRVAALTTAANAVLAEKRGPINPEIAEIILNNDHPDGMKTDELNDWRQTFTNVLNDSQRVREAQEIRKQRNQGRQQRAGERVEAEKAQAAELNEEETRTAAEETPAQEAPTPRTTPEERRAEAERLNEQETARPAAKETPAQEAPTPRTTPAERRAEAELLNQEETRTAAATGTTEETAPTPRTTPAERRAELERLNQEETRTAAATAETEETAPTPRTTPAERRAEAEQLNQEETRTAAATGTTEETAPTPRTTPAERRAEAEQLNEQETRQEPVTQADVMEAIQEESEENDRRTVFAAPATTGAGEAVQITGIVATKSNKDGGAKVEITGADGTVRTVAMKDVRFGRAWQQGAYDIATDLRDVEAARAFLAVAEQESMPLETVKRDFARYYQYGRNRNENMLSVAGKAISDASARAAYEAGVKSLTSEGERVNIPKEIDAAVRKDLERIAKEKPWNQKGYRGVQFGTDVKRLTPGQAVQAYILDKIGKRNGTVYVLTDLNSSRDTSREGQVAGAYQGGNVALIDINAEGGILRAAGHETWHEMVEWASTQDDEGKTTEALRKVQQAVFDALEKTGWDLDVRVKEKKNEYREKLGQELTDEEARDELMADALPEIFNQDASELMHTLDNVENPETKKTILEKLCDIVGRVMDYFKQLAGRIAGRNPEVRAALEADTQAMQNAYDTLRDMQEQMGQDEGWSERAEGADEIRYAANDTDESKHLKDQLIEHQDEINAMEPVANITVLQIDPRTIDKGKGKAARIKDRAYALFKKIGYHVERMGFGNVLIEENQIDKALTYLKTDEEIAAMEAVPYVIKRGNEIYSEEKHKGNNGVGSHTFAAPVVIAGVRGNMAVVVQSTSGNRYKTHKILMPDGSVFTFEQEKKQAGPPRRNSSIIEAQTQATVTASGGSIQQNDTGHNGTTGNDTKNALVDIEQENKNLLAENKNVKGVLKRTAEVLGNVRKGLTDALSGGKTAGLLARSLRNKTGTNVTLKNMRTNFEKVMTVLKAGGQENTQRAFDMLTDIVRDAVWKSSYQVDMEEMGYGQDVKEALSYIESALKHLDADDWKSLKNLVGTNKVNEVRAWVKDKTGMTLGEYVKEGESTGGRGGLDSDYKEMQSALPGIFTEDVTNPEDILEVLLNKAESLKPDTVNDFLEPTARNMGHPEGGEAATQRITMELFTELMREVSDINEEQAEALTEKAQEGQKNREDWVDDTQNVQDIEEKINQDAQVLEDLMKLTKDAVTEVARENKENKDLRRKMEEHDARWRERYQGQTERMERNAQYNKLRNDVVRMTDSLEKKLDHPEKAKGFVPDAMMDAARKLVNAIRNSGGYSARTAREYSAGAETDLKAAQRTGLTPDVLREVRNAYEEMGKTDEGRACFDDDFLNEMDELIKLAEERMADEKSEPGMVGHNRRQAPKLTMKEMELLHSAVSHVNAAVNNANTLFNTKKAETLKEAGDRTFNDLRNRRTTYRDAGRKGRFAGFLDKAKYGMMKPYTMFKTVLRHMGVVNEIYDQVRDGMDKNVRLITQASDFVEDIMKRYPKMQESLNRLKQRGEGKRRAGAVEVKLQSGQTIRVTDQEAMTIYAIYKREQRNYGTDSQTNHLFANEHPEKGGIVLQDREKGTTSLPNMVTDTDIRNIIATIDKDLLPAIDEMVEFLSTTCSEWGNEVSQQLYGVNKFVESYYFPMKVLGSAVDTNMGEGQDARIKTGSQTKRLTKYANNPLEIRAFLDVFDDHVKKMADYSAFTLPVENMSRILNYRDEGGASVHTLIDTAYGEEVYSYLANFVRRVNGNSTIQEEGNKWIKRMISPAKGAAVGANLSVFLQQMGAGVRAMGAENLDTKHALRGMTSVMPFVNMKKIVNFMQKHSAVAAEKAWGYLDTQQLGGVMDRQAKTLYSRLNDLGGYLAGKGDEFNWAQIYMGVLHQTCEKYGADIRDVMKNDEKYTELLADCEKTFKDVVEQTQVYDDMLQRAPFAMEKGLMSNLMAFMNEPITQMNMLMRPLIELNDARRMKDGEAKQKAMAEAAKGLSRSAFAIGVSAVLTSALAAIAQGMRDRDNEKEEEYIDENGNKKKRIVGRRTYWDKVKERWSSLLVDNLLSLGGIYSNIVKGVIQGEGITNDLAFGWAESGGRLLSMIPKCWTQDGGFDLKNMEKAGYYALQTVSNLSGIPFAGFYRDVKAVATTLVEEFVTAGTTEGDAWDISLSMEQRLAAAQNSYVYNKAAKTGEAANRKVNTEIWTVLMMTEYKQHGESATFNKIVAAAQKAGASAGSLMGKFKAEFPKISPLVDKAAQALNRGDFTTYEKAVQEMETRYKLGTKTINAMVNTAFNALQEKPATSANTKSFTQELHADQGNYATVGENVAKDALAKALANGTEKQIRDAVAQAKKQGRTDNEIQTQVRQAYQKDFVDALVSGNKAKAQGIVKKILASGAYDEAGIAEKTLDWVKSENSSGLYESIKRGDSRQAAKVYSWMCQTYGSSTMTKSIASWLRTNASEYEDNVRTCLKAMGYGAASIDKIVKDSYASKKKTPKTNKSNKTKTTKAWE